MTTPTDDRKKSGRTAKGTFAPGNPGGPGRRPGRGPAAEIRAALGADLPGIIERVRTAALAGDLQAARLILDRLCPALRAEESSTALDLPDGTLTEQGRAVVASVAAGDLAPTQGAALLSSLGALAKLTETDELTRRIEALEGRDGR